jgi:hypothetical protein
LSAYSPFQKCYKILWSGVLNPTRYWFDSLACLKDRRGLLLAFNFHHVFSFETSSFITLPTCFHVPVFPSLLPRNNILTGVPHSVRVGDALADTVSWLVEHNGTSIAAIPRTPQSTTANFSSGIAGSSTHYHEDSPGMLILPS